MPLPDGEGSPYETTSLLGLGRCDLYVHGHHHRDIAIANCEVNAI